MPGRTRRTVAGTYSSTVGGRDWDRERVQIDVGEPGTLVGRLPFRQRLVLVVQPLDDLADPVLALLAA
jgi:hypothetical protein